MEDLKHVELYNTSLITKACEDAMLNRKMVGIVDYSGAGKSYALKKFKQKNKGVYLVELGATVPPKEVYVQILNQMRNEEISRSESISNIKRQVKLELEESTGNNLIIIDEASRYEKERVSYFHEMRNLTDHKSGLIICGHRDFESSLKKWSSQGIPGVHEFKSRFSYTITLQRPSQSEIKEIFQINDLLKSEKGRALFKEVSSFDRDQLDYRMIRNLIMERLNK